MNTCRSWVHSTFGTISCEVVFAMLNFIWSTTICRIVRSSSYYAREQPVGERHLRIPGTASVTAACAARQDIFSWEANCLVLDGTISVTDAGNWSQCLGEMLIIHKTVVENLKFLHQRIYVLNWIQCISDCVRVAIIMANNNYFSPNCFHSLLHL